MTLFNRRLPLIVAFLTAATSGAVAQDLGASYSSIKATYQQARPVVLTTGQNALELTKIDYAGVRWDRVDFVFDAQRRLARLTMTTQRSSYQTILALAARENTAPAFSRASDEAPTDLQLRVCESENGEVSLTYEPNTVVT